MAGHQFPEPTLSWNIFSTGTSCCSSLSRSVWVGAFRENPLQVLGLWFIETTSSKSVGRAHVCTSSALRHTATLQLIERLLGAVAIPGQFGEIICKGSPASCLLMKVGFSPQFSELSDFVLALSFPSEVKRAILKM